MRAADQIRIAGISANTLKCVGSHSGCSIGEDGPSQMALEDLAFFRTLPKGIVLVPSDGVSTERAVELAANYNDGPSFIRTARPDVPVLFENDEPFELGKCNFYIISVKVIKKSEHDSVCIISCGVLVHESLHAAQKLAAEGKNLLNSGKHVRLIDIFSLKPLDSEGLTSNIDACHGNVVVA